MQSTKVNIADTYDAQRKITAAVRYTNNQATSNPAVRHVTHYQISQPQRYMTRRVNPAAFAAKGPTAQSIEVVQFNTHQMAARSGMAHTTTASAVRNATIMPQKTPSPFQWAMNTTSVSRNRSALTDPSVPATKMSELMPVPALKEGTQHRTFPGGHKCGVAMKDGELYIRGPATALLKFKKMLNLREGVHFVEEESNSGRLVAIDFDKTIAEIFLWAELGGLEGAEAQLQTLYRWCFNGKLLAAFGGQKRVDQLRSVFQQCKDRGDLLCILSSGFAKVIRPALRLMKLHDLIPDELVYGSDTWPFGISKSQRIIHLKRQHSRPRATLIDDDIGYCRAAMQDGHDVIWVKSGNGAQKREFDALINRQWDGFEYLSYL